MCEPDTRVQPDNTQLACRFSHGVKRALRQAIHLIRPTTVRGFSENPILGPFVIPSEEREANEFNVSVSRPEEGKNRIFFSLNVTSQF
jgi:hypothetical protein